MNQYKIKIELLSDTLVGSAEGHGAIIDNDIIFDEVGLPYIPTRRVKGLLRDSAAEINDMLNTSCINITIDPDALFGKCGNTEGGNEFHIDNLHIPENDSNRKYLKYLISKGEKGTDNNTQGYGITSGMITNYFCNLRKQTSINEITGIAKEGSLHTSRVINKGQTFEGEILFDEKFENVMCFICSNVRKMGTKRNRGLGKIKVSIMDKTGTDITEKGFAVLEGIE